MGCELLSPAGNTECLKAAINAGADAVYVGADRFSARAYADNISGEELVRGIRRAHLCGVRIYLALNTLLTDDEIKQARDLVIPLYESGLDGIIIQDLGLIDMLGSEFPDLPIHASTQMSIMHSEGALLCKELGLSRVVPARELTLQEIRTIKKNVDIELECFIHGAMCYSYSGLCLMSSMIGGRSGNRGRCAGTCRLPFRAETFTGQILSGSDMKGAAASSGYLLSMKDMCTVEILPELIEAGIDSFKIEGRMKSPEYVAGVTAIYRKYIDMYMNAGPEGFSVSKSDIRDLCSLYIRTDISKGYYEGSTGRSLITLKGPGYNGVDDQKAAAIREKYVRDYPRRSVDIRAELYSGKESHITAICDDTMVTVTGAVVQKAKNAPLSRENIIRSIGKTGDSPFECGNIDIDAGDDIFLPVSALNDLRRRVLEELEQKKAGYRILKDIKAPGPERSDPPPKTRTAEENTIIVGEDHGRESGGCDMDIYVSTEAQLAAAINCSDLFDRLIFDYDLAKKVKLPARKTNPEGYPELFVSLPYVLRHRDDELFGEICETIRRRTDVSGVMVHTLDELYFVIRHLPGMRIYADAQIYALNSKATLKLAGLGVNRITIPYEARLRDIYNITGVNSDVKETSGQCCPDDPDRGITGKQMDPDFGFSTVVYGRIPVMISAGCVKKTLNSCDHRRSFGEVVLRDRKDAAFPVITDCNACTNVILNSLPLSLHNMIKDIKRTGISGLRINLTVEDKDESEMILGAFLCGDPDMTGRLGRMEHTTGHLKRGVL